MQTIHTIHELRSAVKQAKIDQPGIRIGFVPTMGFLHKGHASLLEAARTQCDLVILSIFVNPLQFGPNEDFERYPRNEEGDLAVAKAAGTDIVFLPSVEEMYPQQTRTIVSVSQVTERLCGASRPGHFDGVATIVSKLFNIVQPDAAYFGLKDAQQIAVITQMVNDLNMPVEIIPCPILRESDGLAMSSRNVYLQPDERKQALVLSASLQMAEGLIREQHTNIDLTMLNEKITRSIQQAPLAVIDYVEILAYPSLETISSLKNVEQIIIALAVKFGKTRLIDNIIIRLV
ncbi:pantoate--beta-alanine ligase [Paenibacillus radicis (ex Xue et al. 2023)]|uniref:Pantothenate synthetase n=1 Tax=Paenibacillus radicis (ex Xue et al. 2023) TaxID=2972489 RepID=A0ABT1YMW0_9BACL|nr:pantoate--beta-alanine ligase [Paenibacillus radicis (ex Xue et al. 2023)]MCR8634503.1 pantoate--beta-alanine ligase [Paenibacillus radicis (ex Xue et al. 2023)]